MLCCPTAARKFTIFLKHLQPAPAPIFGSASTFGTGTGFGGFTGVAAKTEADGEDDGGEEAGPEEECAAEFKPVVQLDEIEVSTGEEDEETLMDM